MRTRAVLSSREMLSLCELHKSLYHEVDEDNTFALRVYPFVFNSHTPVSQ
jgi:hypothetical protein